MGNHSLIVFLLLPSKQQPKTQNVFEDGWHFVDNVEKVVEDKLPQFSLVFKEKMPIHLDMRESFLAKDIYYFMVGVYKLCDSKIQCSWNTGKWNTASYL